MAANIYPGPYSVEGHNGGRVTLVDENGGTVFSTFEDRNQVENIASAMNHLYRRIDALEKALGTHRHIVSVGDRIGMGGEVQG